FFFSSRRRHTRCLSDWSSDVCSSDLATQYAPVGLAVTGGVDLTVGGLAVNDPAGTAAWSVQPDLELGAALYGDRTFTLASAPTYVLGAPWWLRTANASRTAAADPLVTFTLSAPATVLVAVDTRLGRPAWLDSSWTDTGDQQTDFEGDTTFRRYELFTKAYGPGPVALGPANSGTRATNMYSVVIL